MLDISPETNEVIDEIRRSGAALCEKFPGEYWREQARDRAYPTEFVKALTDAGFLAVLVPEEYGGSGLPISAAAAVLEEIHKSGCNGGACHAQMYIMGTVLRHGSPEQKQKFLPKIASGELRLQAFGVSEPTSGTDTLSLRTTAVKKGNDRYVVNGQKIWTSRAAVAGSNYPKRRSSEENRWSFSFLGGYAGELKKGYGDSSNKNNDQSFYNRNIF